MRKDPKPLILVIIVGLMIGGLLLTGVKAGDDFSSELRPLWQVYQAIRTQYLEKIKPSKLVEAAIKGMIDSLKDPNSRWMDPRSYKEMKEQKKGEFGGLGIQITVKDDFLTIVSPLEGTPASEAGLEPGDRIIKINGESAEGFTLKEAVEKLRGRPGSKVNITIDREGEKEPLEFTITRGIIKVPNIKQRILDEEIGYLKIISFTNENTAKDVRKALVKLKDKEITGLILDLRYNPGGLLSQATAVADQFLSSGVIVSVRGRDSSQVHTYNARPEGEALKVPLVVLINGGSASASEIVAGTIKDHQRGVLLGTKSFGKGTVQSIIPLENGGAIALTTARYYTASEIPIGGEGIEPDVMVEAFKPSQAEREILTRLKESGMIKEFLLKYPQWEGEDLSYLIQKLKEGGIEVSEELLRRVLREEDKDEQNDILNDPQLIRAVELLKSWPIFKEEGFID